MPTDIRNFFTSSAKSGKPKGAVSSKKEENDGQKNDTSTSTVTRTSSGTSTATSTNRNNNSRVSSKTAASKPIVSSSLKRNDTASKIDTKVNDSNLAMSRKKATTSTSPSSVSKQQAISNDKTNTKKQSPKKQETTSVTASTRKSERTTSKRRLIIDDDDDDNDDVIMIEDDNTNIKKTNYVVDLNSDSDDDFVEDDMKSGSGSKRKGHNDDVVPTNTGKLSPQKKLRASPREVIEFNNDTKLTPKSKEQQRKQHDQTSSRSSRSTKDTDDDDDEDKSTPTKTPARKPPPSSSSKPVANKVTSSTSTSKKQKRQSTAEKRDSPLQPEITIESFDAYKAQASILDGYTFVLSGILENISRDDAQEMIKVLGGRVTTAVSSKTDYLVVGTELEDGRPYTEGAKFKKATEFGTVIIVIGERSLYGLFQQYNDKSLAKSSRTLSSATAAGTPTSSITSLIASKSTAVSTPPSKNISLTEVVTTGAVPSSSVVAKMPTVVTNPYARAAGSKITTNPYASKNPYAKKPSSASSSSIGQQPIAINNKLQVRRTDSLSSPVTATKQSSSSNQLWVDKYRPTHSNEILGNQDAVRKLTQWLDTWEQRFNNTQSYGKAFSAPTGPWKAALLSGPPGIGKTTTATLVAKESGRDVIEFNASDVRSKKAMQEVMGDIGGSRTIEFSAVSAVTTVKGYSKKKTATAPTRTKRCIIMDEVDGMGAGDRSGIAELIQMIKHSRVPIICICNDRQNQKLKSLIPYCMDLKYRRPVKSVIANRAIEVAQREGLHVERNAAEAIVESCGNDVRQVLNCLHMWASNNSKKSSSMTYKDLKDREHSINKDEILRVSLFDATRVIVEGRKGLIGADASTERKHFFQRNDAFFVDYSFIGLMVHQNYLKVMQGQFNEVKRMNDDNGTLDFLHRMSHAAESVSDFAVAEHSLRSGQGWSLLPFVAALAVKTGFHAGGNRGGMLPSFPEFTTWLGRNSTKGKKVRILKEIQHHMNLTVSGGTHEIRMSYVPILRERFLSMLTNSKSADIDGAIDMMDEYGLDRDDIFERFDEFKMDPKGRDFSSMDSKMKAAFTRTYNQGVHKSQALVAEQGGKTNKKSSRGSSAVMIESTDLDVIDDDNVADNEEEAEEDAGEDEVDEEKILAIFKKKRSRSKGGGPTTSQAKQRGTKKTKA